MANRRWKRCQQGVSLVEMSVAMAVAGVLAAAGLPQLGRLIQDQAAQSASEAFRSALRLARQEAVRLGEVVTLCARDPRAGDAGTDCLPRGTDWSAGWVLFVDRGRRGVVEDGDRLLRVHQPGQRAPQIDASTARLSFQPTGISFNAASNFRFVPLGERVAAGQHTVLVCVNKAGRARVSASAEACG